MPFSIDFQTDGHAEPGVVIERRSVLKAGSSLDWSNAVPLAGLSGKVAAD